VRGDREARSAWLNRHFSIETAARLIRRDREAMFAPRP
jgi:hypothetical protein